MSDNWRTKEWLEAQIAYIEEARDNGRYNYNEAARNIEKYYNEKELTMYLKIM